MVENRVCRVCGGDAVAGSRGRKPKYCSTKCRMADHRARNAAEPIPAQLRNLDRWILHRNKIPVSPDGRNISVTDESQWMSYDEARECDADGVGFVLNGDGIVCIDLDDVVADIGVVDEAMALINSLPKTYVEFSPSGRGLHIWGLAELEAGRRFERNGLKIEVYPAGRYLTVTGNRFHRTGISRLAQIDLDPILNG